MNKRIYKSKRFIFGVIFFIGLIVTSFIVSQYSKTFFNELPQYMKDDAGNLVASIPYSPEYVFPFGSNRSGENMLYKVLEGSRYTLMIIGGATLIQLVFGVLCGSVLAVIGKRFYNGILKLMQFYYFVPKLMWALLLWQYTSGVYSEYILITLILIPPLIITIAKEVKMILQKEFIESARVLGANKFYIFRKHIWVNIREILVLQFLQQAVQTFTLLIHLGFFNVVIGGTEHIVDIDTGASRYEGNINEWSAMLGIYRVEAFRCPWMTLSPMIMLSLSILVLNIMAQGLKSRMGSNKYSVLS
ncbi:MAG: gsiD 1 [Bacillales bacterium]|jgi:peptide/nickel transport system permease protein|nr:gsiD 1 [Bacillales bacterium]